MYVTNSRCLIPVPWAFALSEQRTTFRSVQETMSWRTGRSVRHSDFGSHIVQPPPAVSSDTPLGDKLHARRRYIEEIGENLVSQNTTPPLPVDRFLTHDTGHSFESVKWTGVGSGSRSVYNASGRIDRYFGPAKLTSGAFGPPLLNPKRLNYYTSGYSIGNLGPDLASNKIDQQALFASARPDSSIAGWGETIVELLRGNLPKVVTTLGRDIASGRFLHKSSKENLKNVSDDYLNSLFGWAPVIRDLESTLRHLLTLHDFLYSQSERRSRSTRIRELSAPLSIVPSVGGYGIAKDDRFGSSQLDGYGFEFKKSGLETYRYDTRLAARFTRARPSAQANAFVDKGLDLLQELGIGYPSLAWDLIPYSFLVDWSVHLGRGIDNYSTYSKDGSYKTDFAYATTKSLHSLSMGPGRSYDRRFPSSWTSESNWTSIQQVTQTTFRRPATPFGFAVDLRALSSAQFGILVALGLARSR